jgi:transposase
MMLSVAPQVGVFVCSRPTDLRKGFDGLHGMVLEVLKWDPLSGDLFVLLNRRRNRVKILAWDGDGLVIWYKRLESGTFAAPQGEGNSVNFSATQLAMLLGGVELKATRSRQRYRRAS